MPVFSYSLTAGTLTYLTTQWALILVSPTFKVYFINHLLVGAVWEQRCPGRTGLSPTAIYFFDTLSTLFTCTVTITREPNINRTGRYLLTPWGTEFREKRIVAGLLKTISHPCTQPIVSLPCLQQPSTGRYPKLPEPT